MMPAFKDVLASIRRNSLPLSILLIGLTVSFGLARYEQRAAIAKQDERTQNELNKIGARIERAVHKRVSVVTGLEAFVHSQQDLDLQQPGKEKLFRYRFSRFVRALDQQVPGILSMQLAPGGVISYMSNLEQNREAIGYDLLVDDLRREQVLNTIANRSLIIAGPLTLIQGGEAIIARKAVYTLLSTYKPNDFISDGRVTPDTDWLQQIPDDFWGLATVLIDTKTLYHAAGLNDLSPQLSYALRGQHGLGQSGEVFWGDARVFEQPRTEVTVALPGGEWILAASYKHPLVSWSALIILAFGVLCTLFIVHAIRQTLEKRQVLALNNAKSDFLATMSHELRTPLNAILGFAQLLQHDKKLDEDQRDSVYEINRAGHHLLALVNDVLDLVKIEAGHLDLSIQRVAVVPVINECRSLLAPAANDNLIRFNLHCEESLHILADAVRLKQALLNLLSNAVKYNKRGGTVEIECRDTGRETLRISISDTGRGIPQQRMKQLFQPFNRLGMKNSHIEGTGIGLTIVKMLVTNMNGTVGASSTENVGSCFWLELPLTPPPDTR